MFMINCQRKVLIKQTKWWNEWIDTSCYLWVEIMTAYEKVTNREDAGFRRCLCGCKSFIFCVAIL